MDDNIMDSFENNKPAKSKKQNIKGKGRFFRDIIKSNKIDWGWPVKIFFVTFALSMMFSIGSELILSAAGLIISISVIVVLLVVSVISDMVGVAVAAASLEPFVSMASRKVAGSKEAMYLVKHAEKVSSFASDVVGDICGILSGAVGAAIVIKIYTTTGNFTAVLIASIVSSIIAGLTDFGKAVGKNLAINYPEKIVFKASKLLTFFKIKK